MKNKNRKRWIGIYAISIVLLLVLHYSLHLTMFSSIEDYIPFLQKFSITLAIVSVILLIRTSLEKLIQDRTETRGESYNLIRVTRLISSILIIIIAISFLFQKPYTALAGVGVVSLVLGFALQAPITSFIAWLYIIFRRPYQVGDRIQINKHRGDVVEISYLDTIIQECHGDYLKNDRRSGRLVHFPNSIILKDKVINYSGPMAPFIWNETAVQISYSSDIQYVEDCLMEAAISDFKKKYPNRYERQKDQWKPAVYFRNNQYAWMEAVVSYPVEPLDTTGRRNRILKYALPLLNDQPEKVQFPEGRLR